MSILKPYERVTSFSLEQVKELIIQDIGASHPIDFEVVFRESYETDIINKVTKFEAIKATVVKENMKELYLIDDKHLIQLFTTLKELQVAYLSFDIEGQMYADEPYVLKSVNAISRL